MTKSEVLQQGFWPPEFLDNLVSETPPITTSSRTKLKWKCPIHGDYEQSIELHLHGRGCPSCAKHSSHKSRRSKNPLPDWFIEDLDPPLRPKVLSQELSISSKLRFLCKEHGYYIQNGYHHLAGHLGCPVCKNNLRTHRVRESRRLNNPFPEWFISEIHPEDRERVLNLELTTNDKVRFICPKHGVYEQTLYAHINMSNFTRKSGCPSCAAEISKYGSSLESKLRKDLESIGLEVQKTKGLIKSPITNLPMELDLYIPEYKIAIEVNGLYFHSLETMKSSKTFNAFDKKFYHRMKTDLCKNKGIQLIHLWEDDLRDRYEVCFNLILSKLRLKGYKDTRVKLYARSCKILQPSVSECRDFYAKYHIQGWGQGMCLGLYQDNILYSCMSFKRCSSNTKQSDGWELNRYATKDNYNIVGGFDKLLNHFIKTVKPLFIISYADITVSDGSLYFNHGWDLIGEVPVDYKYVYKSRRYHKFNFRIKRFKEDPNLKYEQGLSENQLAALNGITHIYDCGKLKFRYEVKSNK